MSGGERGRFFDLFLQPPRELTQINFVSRDDALAILNQARERRGSVDPVDYLNDWARRLLVERGQTFHVRGIGYKPVASVFNLRTALLPHVVTRAVVDVASSLKDSHYLVIETPMVPESEMGEDVGAYCRKAEVTVWPLSVPKSRFGRTQDLTIENGWDIYTERVFMRTSAGLAFALEGAFYGGRAMISEYDPHAIESALRSWLT